MPENQMTDKLQREQNAFDAALEGLLKDHEKEFVIFQNLEPSGFFPSFEEAYEAGLERFGLDTVFFVSEVKKRGPASVSVSWDLGVMYAEA